MVRRDLHCVLLEQWQSRAAVSVASGQGQQCDSLETKTSMQPSARYSRDMCAAFKTVESSRKTRPLDHAVFHWAAKREGTHWQQTEKYQSELTRVPTCPSEFLTSNLTHQAARSSETMSEDFVLFRTAVEVLSKTHLEGGTS